MIESMPTHPVFQDVEIGIGTWAWGDRLYWGFGRGYADSDLREAYQTCIAAGVFFFDTAEVYGQGKSEIFLGEFAGESQVPIRIATKFYPIFWRLNRGSFVRALRGSLKRLKRSRIELYQMHWPWSPVKIESWMEAMADAHQNGLIDAVGVSNYTRDQMQRAYDTLSRYGIRLASNQVEYHLLNRAIEKNGLLDHCQSLGVKCIAYSPIAKGVLSGKYTPNNPLRGFRESSYPRRLLEKIQPLIKEMRNIGMDHGGRTPAQVAINWTICKGTLPIPGIKNARQAQDNLEAVGWRLTEAEVDLLDDLSDRVQST